MRTSSFPEVDQDPPTFVKLNRGWNAHPNAPYLSVRAEGRDLVASFVPDSFDFVPGSKVTFWMMRFQNCSAFRETMVNDHGWYGGQCRFSNCAPSWGHFYELAGNCHDSMEPEPWRAGDGTGCRHFHFYLRDSALEVKADDWRLLRRDGERDDV